MQAALHWTALTHDLADRVLARDNLLILAVTFPMLKLLHELGHCYAAKIGGASVHEAGIMTLVVMPVPYVDVSGASAFTNKWRRALVGAAGMLTELFCAGIAMIVWTNVGAGPGARGGVQLPADRRRLHAAVQRQSAAAVRRLLHPVGPDRDSQSRHPRHPLLRLSGEPLRVRRARPDLAGAGAAARRHGSRSTALPRTLYRLWVMLSIALFVAAQLHGVGAVLAAWTVASGIVYPLVRGALARRARPGAAPAPAARVLVTGAAAGLPRVLLFGVKLPYRHRDAGRRVGTGRSRYARRRGRPPHAS